MSFGVGVSVFTIGAKHFMSFGVGVSVFRGRRFSDRKTQSKHFMSFGVGVSVGTVEQNLHSGVGQAC